MIIIIIVVSSTTINSIVVDIDRHVTGRAINCSFSKKFFHAVVKDLSVSHTHIPGVHASAQWRVLGP